MVINKNIYVKIYRLLLVVIISVCIATYNGHIYIRKQLESTLCQLSTNDEVIVSDDSSTDYAINIVESLNDNCVIIFSN
ncbi:glycosyltransferase [Bacteroides fragilis]|nr:glycosyltransferase [Bacteroides fragilis]